MDVLEKSGLRKLGFVEPVAEVEVSEFPFSGKLGCAVGMAAPGFYPDRRPLARNPELANAIDD